MNKYNNHFLVFLALVFISTLSYGQVVIGLHGISSFQFASKDVLNFNVVYTGSHPVKVQYVADIKDDNGRAVVQFLSQPHVLRKGANAYNPTNFGIAQINYANRSIAAIENATSFLPPGDYTYCITLRCIDNQQICAEAFNPELTYSECAQAHAESITPLLLSSPMDEAVLDVKRPNFSWIPPMPFGNGTNLTYTFKLVEILNEQTAEDAIRRNRAMYERAGIRSISTMFPSQLDDLEPGQHYAWQVSGHIGEVHIATSEVWKFEVEKKTTITHSYTVKKSIGLTGYSQPINRDMKVVFEERYAETDGTNWVVRMKDEQRQEWQELDYLGDLNKHLGKSNIQIQPSAIQDLQPNRNYLFEFSNNKRDKYYVRIRFVEPIDKESTK